MKELQDKLTPLLQSAGGAGPGAGGMPAGFDPSQFAGAGGAAGGADYSGPGMPPGFDPSKFSNKAPTHQPNIEEVD